MEKISGIEKNAGKVRKSLFPKKEKNSAPVPIPKLDLSFSSQYQNLVLVAHYFTVNNNNKKIKIVSYFLTPAAPRISLCRAISGFLVISFNLATFTSAI